MFQVVKVLIMSTQYCLGDLFQSQRPFKLIFGAKFCLHTVQCTVSDIMATINIGHQVIIFHQIQVFQQIFENWICLHYFLTFCHIGLPISGWQGSMLALFVVDEGWETVRTWNNHIHIRRCAFQLFCHVTWNVLEYGKYHLLGLLSVSWTAQMS